MRAHRSLVGTLAAAPVLRNAWLRRAIVALLLVVCAVLSFFPERYRAAVSLTPSDPMSIGIGGALGQLGAINSVFGNQAQVEVSIKVAKSEYVRSIISRQLNLQKRLGKSRVEVHRWLGRKVDVRALRGGIIQIEMKLADPEFAREIVGAYGNAVRDQLAIIAHRQTDQKRLILEQLFRSSADRLAAARTAYDTFRLTTRYSSPQAAFYAAGDRIPQLETEIRFKQVELNAMRQFATDENIRVAQLKAAIEALHHQLDVAKSTSPGAQSSVGQVVRQTTQAEKLMRELQVAQALYDNYKRYLQGTSVEDLTAGVTTRILEPAFVDTDRQLNMAPLGAGILILLLALALEFYGMRPPIEEMRRADAAAA